MIWSGGTGGHAWMVARDSEGLAWSSGAAEANLSTFLRKAEESPR